MAVYKIYPEKDSTMYSLFPFMNTGIDEILETSTTTFGVDVNPHTSRALIKFSTKEMNDVINDTIGGLTNLGQANLKCNLATAEGLNVDSSLEIFPVSGSWEMGTGKYLDNPVTWNGVSWQWRDYSGSAKWLIANTVPVGYTTASWDSNGINGGGNWWIRDPQDLSNELINITQSINYSDSKDINSDVTSMVKTWYSSSNGIVNPIERPQIYNDGFIIKPKTEFVYNRSQAVELKYFSIDTNTIYPPQLELKWDDFEFNTGSSDTRIISTRNLVASLQDNPGTFRLDSIYDFRINCRPKFPPKTFQTSSIYTTNHYLPTSSYYAIKDLDTNEFVVDFDTTYTKISADEESSYFRVYMNGLEPERYYQILIKTVVGRDTMILDDQYYFKVING
jgi:hypothetical protein